MARIFISYRRDDSADAAGRLADRLVERFGQDQVFMDIDTIEAGMDFVEAIKTAVAECEVLLVVIGRHWLTITDERNERRLDNSEDFVRLEIAAALDRDIRVIPILVQGAPMPRSQDLPPALAKLARRQAREIRHATWKRDVQQLIELLENLFNKSRLVLPQLRPEVTKLKSLHTTNKNKNCSKCGAQNDPPNAFCKECGTRLDARAKVNSDAPAELNSLVCSVCGQENGPYKVFCEKCGAILRPPNFS